MEGIPKESRLLASYRASTTITFHLVSPRSAEFTEAILAHYTGSSSAPPGKALAWRVRENGAHRGWIGLGEPPFKLAPRRHLGLIEARPLPKTVCCNIYRLDAPGNASASDILRKWHPSAEALWETTYGWRPVHWETMIGTGTALRRKVHEGPLGACFRRSGYRKLGWTTGRTARSLAGCSVRQWGWSPQGAKLVLYRGPLARLPGVWADETPPPPPKYMPLEVY